MPVQTAGPGTGAPSRVPVIAADTGVTPARSPARPGPSLPTALYQSTNATAVTPTARYATAAH